MIYYWSYISKSTIIVIKWVLTPTLLRQLKSTLLGDYCALVYLTKMQYSDAIESKYIKQLFYYMPEAEPGVTE